MKSAFHYLAVAFIASCLALAATSVHAGAYEETTPFVGIRHIHRTMTLPRLLDVNVVEIDPTAPGVDFLVTPSNGAAPGETVAQTTRAFATQHQTQVAVNASFFAYVSGANMNIEGLAASRGDVYSSFQPARTVALNISQSKLATIIESTLGTGTEHSPPASLYNAVGGNERILVGGAITAGDTVLHPRTAAGVTAEGKIIVMTVDGRNSGHSLGVTTPELANMMLQYGVRDAINLDGGGSTTLVFSDPTPRLVNVPVGVGNVPGSERSNGNNFGVFAAAYAQPTNSRFVYSDFELSDSGHFGRSLLSSGSTAGVLGSSSIAVGGGGRPESPGSQRLVIRDDPTISSSVENPDGWFVRHLSGAPGSSSAASRSVNEIRPTIGVVGLWARTLTPSVEVTIAIDDTNNVTADRGVSRLLVNDGQWHRYEWDLQNPAEWQGWSSGDGVISTSDFTIDSIQLFGPNADAVVFIDDVFHETLPEVVPVTGDFDFDGDVDRIDLALWRRRFGATSTSPADADGDLDTDGADFLAWQRNLGMGVLAPGTAVSEPSTCVLALVAIVLFIQTLHHGLPALNPFASAIDDMSSAGNGS